MHPLRLGPGVLKPDHDLSRAERIRQVTLVAGVAPFSATMDTCCPSWMSQGIIDRNTAIEPWGGVSRPLFLDCGFRPNHQPVVIPDRLIGRFQPTLALRTRMGGARRILARVQPGQHSRRLP